MKIAFPSPQWPDGHNGIIPYVRLMSRAFHELGHQVIILTHHARRQLGYEQMIQMPDEPPHSRPAQLVQRIAPGLGGPFDRWKAVADSIANALTTAAIDTPIDVLEMEESFALCGMVASVNLHRVKNTWTRFLRARRFLTLR
ncbi:MAG: hypothetical protein ABIQ86_13555 [Steroidobacteraceae bacterium]